MAIALKPLDPRIQMSPRLWVGLLWSILYVTCVVFGIVVAALIGTPIPSELTFLFRGTFVIILVLTVIVLGLTARHLTRVLIVARAAWHWVVLLAGMAASIAVALWLVTAQSPDDSKLEKLGMMLPSLLGIGAGAAAATYALVMIVASYNADPLAYRPRRPAGSSGYPPPPDRRGEQSPPARPR